VNEQRASAVDVVIEIPRGSRNKYEMDQETGRIWLDRTLFTSTSYPADYGMVPGTLAEDDDPLDALVLVNEPTFPGCVIRSRPVGVFWMSDEHGPDAKLVCVPADDTRFEEWEDIADLPESMLNEISHFFDVYKDLEPGKSSSTRGWGDAREARQVLAEAIERRRRV
jgi:inorganic pyrophosphatase